MNTLQLLDSKAEGEVLHLTAITNRLDANVARQFKEEGKSALNPDIKKVELDLKKVEFIDSSGIGALLNLYKQLPKSGDGIHLHHVQPSVQSVIELLRLHRVFNIAA